MVPQALKLKRKWTEGSIKTVQVTVMDFRGKNKVGMRCFVWSLKRRIGCTGLKINSGSDSISVHTVTWVLKNIQHRISHQKHE